MKNPDQLIAKGTYLPPIWLDKLANIICAPHLREELIGDLHERHAFRCARIGKKKARILYLKEVLLLFRPSVMKRKPSENNVPYFNFDMLINYFKISTRVLLKNKGYSLIHLTGLSIGLWACMMVATVVIDSLSYDRQWTKGKDLYRIVSINKMGEGLSEKSNSTPSGLGPELKRLYPEVESYGTMFTSQRHFQLEKNGSIGIKTEELIADTTVWKMLDIKVVAGNPKVYVEGSKNLLVSRSFVEKFFNGKNPVGKIIYDVPTYREKPTPFLITGVIENLPYNSHLRAEVISLQKNDTEPLTSTGFMTFSRNYIVMKPGTDIAAFTAKVNRWHAKFSKDSGRNQFEFQPMQEVYLHSDFAEGEPIRGNAKTIYIFSGVAFLLLFIACVNFVNLSTARAFARLKEAGVRKVLSGSRYQLISQLLAETLIVFLAAIVTAFTMYQLSIKSVENFLGHRLIETFTSNPALAGISIGAILGIALLTGLYPAWLISGLKPTNSLRGIVFASSSFSQNWLRKSLVVVQFSISVVVLLGAFSVRQQLTFMENKDLGFEKSHLLAIDFISWDGKSDAFKNEVLAIPGVKNASVSQWIPTKGGGNMVREIGDPLNVKNKIKVWYIFGDVDLPATLGLQLEKGRLFDRSFSTDALNADSLQRESWKKYEEATKSQTSVITSYAAKALKINKLNEQITNANTIPIGVVRDFNNESLHELIKPTVILAQRGPMYGGMLIRVQPGTEKLVTLAVAKLWKQFYTSKLFQIDQVDDMLAKQYEAESRIHQLFTFFSSLIMFLSALGIFGLVVQTGEQRAKEVGIRKVLGASVAGIIALLSRDFLKLVILAIVIASPLAWYFIHQWLQTYPYRTEVSPWIFAFAGMAAIFTTMLTISFQALKSALTDPVKSLRNE